MRHFSLRRRARPKGQLLIIVAMSTLVLLMFTGLAIDLAQYLIYRAHLRRAVDAAAMAAAAHFRAQYHTVIDMETAMLRVSQEALALNGIDPSLTNIEVVTSISRDGSGQPICNDPSDDINRVPDKFICFPRQRKKVWVSAQLTYPTAFIRLFSVKEITITASAVGEAASLDVVLVVDISGSLAYAGDGDPFDADGTQDDPSYCNQFSARDGDAEGSEAYYRIDPDEEDKVCLPFEHVRLAAIKFVKQILDLSCNTPGDPLDCMEQDRVGIVLFSSGWEESPGCSGPTNCRGTFAVMAPNGTPWFQKASEAEEALWNIGVYNPPTTFTEWDEAGRPAWPGVARAYTIDGTRSGGLCNPETDSPCIYAGNVCMIRANSEYPSIDPSLCLSTNIGGGLAYAAQVLATDQRPDALRVVIILTTGAANATGPVPAPADLGATFPDSPLPDKVSVPQSILPFGYCPPSTHNNTPAWLRCRDLVNGGLLGVQRRGSYTDPNFDADDFAYYFADYVGCPPDTTLALSRGCARSGQGAVMFAIGMGQEVVSPLSGSPPAGAALLRYIAALGDDNDPSTSVCGGVPYVEDCGHYFYRQSGSEIADVFTEIGRRIFTRISH